MKTRVLVVDDEKNITFVISAILEKAGFEAKVFNDSEMALLALKKEKVSAVITDLNMPKKNGMEILKYCRKNLPRVPVVMITAFGTVESAVAALKQGAFDYVSKPFEQTELLAVVRKAVETYRLSESETVTNEELQSSNPDSNVSSMIGSSPQMEEIFRVIKKVARSPSTVLIWGESGTGKELVAFEVHRLSDRAEKPFIKINCAAIPATLIESELFGYEKGAFTGAVTSKPGRFELANEGTLFLDEVAEMPLEMQVKLLRVLQEQEFERVGAVSTTKVDVRIITATNKDLAKEVKEGRFREDLYYRLNVVPIHLPPLRDRGDDIDALAHFFLNQFNVKLGKNVSGFEPACLRKLRTFNWPGNIRQLENVVERMVLMSEGESLKLNELPPEILNAPGNPASEGMDGHEHLENIDPGNFKEIVRRQTQSIERELIERALEETAGNVTRAAEKLGLSRKGLQLKLKELGVKRPEPDPEK